MVLEAPLGISAATPKDNHMKFYFDMKYVSVNKTARIT